VRLAQLRKREKPLVVRLGDELTRKNIKPGLLLRKWDSNGNGVVEYEEFRTNIRELGLHATDEEIAKLFGMLDDDGSGALELSEIKPVLRKLHEEVLKATAEESKLERSAQQSMKKSLASQQLLLESEKAEELAISEKHAARRKEKEEREKDKQKVENQKAEAAKKAMQEKAAKKAQFEQNVQEKRKPHQDKSNRTTAGALQETLAPAAVSMEPAAASMVPAAASTPRRAPEAPPKKAQVKMAAPPADGPPKPSMLKKQSTVGDTLAGMWGALTGRSSVSSTERASVEDGSPSKRTSLLKQASSLTASMLANVAGGRSSIADCGTNERTNERASDSSSRRGSLTRQLTTSIKDGLVGMFGSLDERQKDGQQSPSRRGRQKKGLQHVANGKGLASSVMRDTQQHPSER